MLIKLNFSWKRASLASGIIYYFTARPNISKFESNVKYLVLQHTCTRYKKIISDPKRCSHCYTDGQFAASNTVLYAKHSLRSCQLESTLISVTVTPDNQAIIKDTWLQQYGYRCFTTGTWLQVCGYRFMAIVPEIY